MIISLYLFHIPGALDKTKKMGKTNIPKTKGGASSSKSCTSRSTTTDKTESIEYDSDGYTTPTKTTKTKTKGSASSSKSHTSRSTTASIKKVVKSLDLGSNMEDVNTGREKFNIIAVNWRDIDEIKAGVLAIKPEWDHDDIVNMTTVELHEVLFDAMDMKTFRECYMGLSVSGGVFCTGLGYHEMKEHQKSWKSLGKLQRSKEIRSLLKELQTKLVKVEKKPVGEERNKIPKKVSKTSSKSPVHEERNKSIKKVTKLSSRSIASTAAPSESDSEQSSNVGINDFLSDSEEEYTNGRRITHQRSAKCPSRLGLSDKGNGSKKGKKSTRRQPKCDDNSVDEFKTSPPKKIKVEPGTQEYNEDSTDEDINETPQKPQSKNTKIGVGPGTKDSDEES